MPLNNVGVIPTPCDCLDAVAQMVSAGIQGSRLVSLIPSRLQAEVLASGAGDAAVKLWSFSRRRCMATLHGVMPPLQG